ncbi:hypothetical protein CMI37_19275 [Candidatus Pacearchaeota archaeon]|nr:hypothetical protein [Candidatus Pacearchaeota archaeon]
MKKKKLLFHSDSALAKTGFGRNSKELLSYLYDTGKYEIYHYCCGAAKNSEELNRTPWKSLGTLPNDKNLLMKLNQDPQQGKEVNYGGYFINDVIKEVKPDVYIGAQDIWGLESSTKKEWYDKITSAIWTTLDSLPLYPNALEIAKKVKNFWVWSSFAEKEFNRLDIKGTKTVHGAINKTNFKKLPQEKRLELRRKFNIEEDAFIIGFVFRNQLRKSVPNLIEGYAKWKKITKPSRKTYLLLHTHWSEGWNIHKLCKEYEVPKEEIITTHICKKCKNYFVKPFKGQEAKCETCSSEKAQVTCSVTLGIEEKELNEIYNLMDVYCHPFTSGGQEIPIQEAKLTELITLVTNYSCGEESCEKGSASLPLEWSEYREAGTQFRKASTCPNSIAKNLDKVFQMMPEERQKLEKKARKWAIKNYSTEVTGKIIEEFIDSAPFADFDFKSLEWKARNPTASISNIEDDSEWLTHIYKNILSMSVDKMDDGHKYWMKQLNNKTPRKNVENFFRNKAEEENKENLPFKIEKELDKDDEGKRLLVVMPGSIGDVFMSTSVLKSLANSYENYNIYFATAPEYFEMLEANPFIHKVIPYNSRMDDLLWLEGRGEHKGFFEVAYLLHLGTQRVFNYQHNGKDIIALDLAS